MAKQIIYAVKMPVKHYSQVLTNSVIPLKSHSSQRKKRST